MNGRDLYAYYREANRELGVDLEPWECLTDTEQAAWMGTADAAREACA